MVIKTLNNEKEQKLELMDRNEKNSISFVLKSHKIIDKDKLPIDFKREQFELSIDDVKKLIDVLQKQI